MLGVLLPLGVVGQAVLGGFTVRNHLAPGFVMGHFALSMLILVAAVALAWRARYEPGERPRSLDRLGVWAVRGLLALGALTIFFGTVATAAGPHAGGGGTGDTIDRLEWRGNDTRQLGDPPARRDRDRARHRDRRRLLPAAPPLRARGHPDARSATAAVLLAIQGLVGAVQYALEVPAEIVWVHVGLATLTWLTLLWATAAAGRPAPASMPLPAASEEAAETPPAHVGAVLGGSRRVVR